MLHALPMALIFMAAAPSEEEKFRELLAMQKTKRASCEEALKDLARKCPLDAPKMRQARLHYRKAREKTNVMLETIVLDIHSGRMRSDYGLQAQEAESSAIQLQNYLDYAECDGSMPQTKEPLALALLFKLPGLILTVKNWVQGRSASKADAQARQDALIRDLQSMYWRSFDEVIGGNAPLSQPSSTSSGPQASPVLRQLRLETGFHMAAIRQMAVTPDGKFAVTAGEDKTLRLWDAGSLTLIKTLRPPLNEGDCGKLYAAAITPDGHTLLASGFTRNPEGGTHHVYVMDARDGRLIREISGFPQVVNRLSLSPDGSHFVAHLGGNHGIRVHRLADGAEVARDTRFGGPTFGGAFYKDGRFAVSADDGYVRLYGKDFKMLAKMKAAGSAPFGLSFSPDGSKLAVGYADAVRVDIFSGKTLFPIAQPALEGAVGPLSSVAWSMDGRKLYAGGGSDFGLKRNVVYTWADGGRGARSSREASWATISDLAALPSGRLLLAAQDPRLALFNADGTLSAAMEASPGELRQARTALKVDQDGSSIALGWRFADRPSAVFSFQEQALHDASTQLSPPIQEAIGLVVKDWQDSEKPTFNGALLSGLEPHEMVRSLSIAKDLQGFVLGTDWCLRRYDARGFIQKSQSLPAACWGLNHSPNGQHLVAALADGTLRWFKPDSLDEVMGLYLEKAGGRWVMWHKVGYYAASVGGEALLGWHVQREGEAGDFFPAGKFREECFKPTYFVALLKGQDAAGSPVAAVPAPAASQTAAKLPPVVSILDPVDGSSMQPGQAEFRVQVRHYGEALPVKAFTVYVDGKKLPATRGLRPRMDAKSVEVVESIYTVGVSLPPRSCKVAVVAETEQGASEATAVSLVYPVQAPAVPAKKQDAAAPVSMQAKAPDLNILAIGVADYRNPKLSLKYPAKDARDVAEIFHSQQKKLYGETRVKSLVNQEATKDNVLMAIRNLQGQAKQSDVSIVFFSGHGLTNPATQSYYFVPFDADVTSANALDTLVDGKDIQAAINETEGKVVLMMDTCHAGNVMGEGKLRGLEDSIKLTSFINELASAENGVTVFSSSTGRQLSLESVDWNNGAFTKALREGLGGKADVSGSGRVTLDMLDSYLRARVSELTKGMQTPVSGKPSSNVDFPLVVLK